MIMAALRAANALGLALVTERLRRVATAIASGERAASEVASEYGVY
jgi:hypothetical protein